MNTQRNVAYSYFPRPRLRQARLVVTYGQKASPHSFLNLPSRWALRESAKYMACPVQSKTLSSSKNSLDVCVYDSQVEAPSGLRSSKTSMPS